MVASDIDPKREAAGVGARHVEHQQIDPSALDAKIGEHDRVEVLAAIAGG